MAIATSILSQLMSEIKEDGIAVIDLTQNLNEQTPVIELPAPFANTNKFSLEVISKYDEKGPFFYWNNISMSEHCGTHFDAPVHWLSGKEHTAIDEIPAKRLIGEACVIDITEKCEQNPDYCLTVEDILQYEEQYGKIPAHAWVLIYTGWAKYINDAKFFNIGEDGQPHTPGTSVEAAEFLATQRDILGVGVETVGTDAGLAGGFSTPFPNHYYMHGNNKYGLASLTNLQLLPPRGAIVIATPLKIENGSGSPARVIAFVEK